MPLALVPVIQPVCSKRCRKTEKVAAEDKEKRRRSEVGPISFHRESFIPGKGSRVRCTNQKKKRDCQ